MGLLISIGKALINSFTRDMDRILRESSSKLSSIENKASEAKNFEILNQVEEAKDKLDEMNRVNSFLKRFK